MCFNCRGGEIIDLCDVLSRLTTEHVKPKLAHVGRVVGRLGRTRWVVGAVVRFVSGVVSRVVSGVVVRSVVGVIARFVSAGVAGSVIVRAIVV